MNKIFFFIIVILIALGAWYFFMSDKPNTQTTTQSDGKENSSIDTKKMTFFVTSTNPGNGGNLNGLAGADAYCTSLAKEAGAKKRKWAAYLSATENDVPINAKDRIGNGPWQNAKGVVIAKNNEELHNENNISKETALDETGKMVNGRGDSPNQHDILTGSTSEGMAIQGGGDSTCNNWTSGDDGAAMVGHHDRIGLRDDAPSKSWNASHNSRGCSLDDLAGSGGSGLFYCFASE